MVPLQLVLDKNIFQVTGVIPSEPATPKRKGKKEESIDQEKKKVEITDGINGSFINVSGPKKRVKFELPEGFTVVEKQTEKKCRKEYHGPNGEY